ncbi:MAG: ATP-binding protein [Alphaproteobacteria bacterium]
MDVAASTQPLDERTWRQRNEACVSLGLAWLLITLEDHVRALRASRPPRAGDGSLSDVEADWLLREPPATPPSAAREAARRAYDDARATLREAGQPAAIDVLSTIFSLAPFDEDVLLLALAPRVETRFAALYGYAHDRLSVAYATEHLCRMLLAPGGEVAQLAHDRLGPDMPLRRFALITLGEREPGMLSAIDVDERIACFLRGKRFLDPRVRQWLSFPPPMPCPERHGYAVARLLAQAKQQRRAAALILGPRGSGRRAVAQRFAEGFGTSMAELEPRQWPGEPRAARDMLALLAREAALGGFGILLDAEAESAGPDAELRKRAHEIAAELARGFDGIVAIVAQDRLNLPTPLPEVRLQALEAADRTALWADALGVRAGRAQPAIEAVAEHFQLGPSEIARIAAQLPEAIGEALWPACREFAAQGLGELAQRIEPRYGWGDIVLPETVRADLEAIAVQVRFRAGVYGRWGFAGRLHRGRGVSALFAGPSGVGKTMAAEVVARELGLDLYRIDLSGIVSKYIGETEKNLRRIFEAAEAAGAVLFFDEADALFGKRSEVKDSHDRYANIEVSYLLQRMESYSGLAVLATNLKNNLDHAFLRRLRFVIDFPFPDAAQRQAIWRRAFPPETPTEGIDCAALARLEIAGGNIVVIAVNAAFLAAAEGTPVRLEHVARAARAEFRKLDREFRPPWLEGR